MSITSKILVTSRKVRKSLPQEDTTVNKLAKLHKANHSDMKIIVEDLCNCGLLEEGEPLVTRTYRKVPKTTETEKQITEEVDLISEHVVKKYSLEHPQVQIKKGLEILYKKLQGEVTTLQVYEIKDGVCTHCQKECPLSWCPRCHIGKIPEDIQ